MAVQTMAVKGWETITAGIGIDHLATAILDSDRDVVIVVVSISAKASGPYVDLKTIADQVEGSARLVLLGSPTASWELTAHLGDEMRSVFGGAARIYPLGTRWHSHPYDAPLHFCYPGQGKVVASRVVEDVRTLAWAASAPLLTTAVAGDIQTTAKVEGVFTEAQVMVRSATGRQCFMLAAALHPGVPAQRLLAPGVRLTGRERSTGMFGEFLPDPIEDDACERARHELPDGSVTLAKVESVTATSARVLVHPSVAGNLVDQFDDLTLLLSVGDDVPVEVAWEDNTLLAVLAREGDAGPSMSILPGGPPWLIREHRTDRKEGSTTDAHVIDLTRPSLAESIGDAGVADPESSATINLLTAANTELKNEIAGLRGQLRELQRELREQSFPSVYTDPEEQFRFEIEMSYLMRVMPADRAQFQMPKRYELGRGFLASVDHLLATGSISRSKIVDVCAEVLCRRAWEVVARAPKEWRTSKQGPQELRSDGALAWRVRLQVNSSSARRMKYWVRRDQVIEFDSVGVHDDGL